jgi:hypothetical protein
MDDHARLARRFALVLVIGALSAATAQAQGYAAKVTLPHEVSWAGAVLPPGSYSLYMDSIKGPLTVYDAAGRVRARVYGTMEDPLKTKPAALLVTREGTEWVVRSFNCPDWGIGIVSKPFTRAERSLLAEERQTEAIAVRVASR